MSQRIGSIVTTVIGLAVIGWLLSLVSFPLFVAYLWIAGFFGSSFEAEFEKGKLLASRGDHKTAIVCLDEALRIDPESSAAHNARGEVYAAVGQKEKAKREFNRAIDLDANNHAAYANRAQHQSLAEAIADFDRAITIAPDRSEYYQRRGKIHWIRRDIDAATDDYDQAVKLGNVTSKVLMHRCFLRLIGGDLDRARSEADFLVERFSEDAKSHITKARVLLGAGDYDGAMASIIRAQAMDPRNESVSNARGIIEMAAGNIDQAIAAYDRAIRLDYEFAYAYRKRGIAKASQEMWEEALADLSEAIQHRPDEALYYADRAAVNLAAGYVDEAITDCNAGLAIDSYLPSLYAIRGHAYAASGEEVRARRDKSEAIFYGYRND